MHILEPIEEQKELEQEERKKLAQTIADNFHKWDDDRNSQITTAKEIMEETYLNQPRLAVEKDMEWKSDVKLNAIYNIKRAKKSVLWREMWSNPAQMFDVRGTSEQTEELAKAQKAAIVDSLTKMNVGKAFDNGIDNLFDIGEIIFKTDWEKRSKVVKRQVKNKGFVLQNLVRLMGKVGFQIQTEQMQDVVLPYYENARVESISPFMFVFDHSKWDFKRETWEKLIKISKRFETLDDLKQNKLYDITPEMIAELNEDKENKTAENKELMDLRDENYYGGKYSVLYAHGDFKINGKIYKNYIAEVLAGKYLIRFEENPLWICPFILCALEYDPLTKRGISPLKSIMSMCKEEERLTNTAFDVQKLTANPCYWANEDLFDATNTDKDGNVRKVPGKVLKFKNDLAGSLPIPIEVSANGISDLLGFLNNRISEVSSVSDVMFGNIESAKRTATELSLADKGSSSQAGKELDTINQDLTLPMIENVSELLAMFKNGDEVIYYEDKGKRQEIQITNTIRQAQYNYYFEDRNALIERKARFNELFNLFKEVGANDVLFNMIDWKEIITSAVEMIGFDNTDKFFKDDSEIDKVAEFIKQLPPELQQAILQNIQPLLQSAEAVLNANGYNLDDAKASMIRQGQMTIPQMMQQVPQI